MHMGTVPAMAHHKEPSESAHKSPLAVIKQVKASARVPAVPSPVDQFLMEGGSH